MAGWSAKDKLNDRDWLADRYRSASGETIARELGCAPSTVLQALRRHGIPVRDCWSSARLHLPPEIDDADWLREQYLTKSATQIAAELGVSVSLAYKAMRRLGVDREGAWVRRDQRRLRRPAKRTLERLWRQHKSFKGVAVELGVAHTDVARL